MVKLAKEPEGRSSILPVPMPPNGIPCCHCESITVPVAGLNPGDGQLLFWMIWPLAECRRTASRAAGSTLRHQPLNLRNSKPARILLEPNPKVVIGAILI